jgi:RNA polymerase sigma-70 factor (ECF subfamily)
MTDQEWLAARFEENRGHLRTVAYRMLGSLAEADDAVQESWLRLSRSDASTIENLSGWLTTVVARVSLDMLRSRASRREDSIDAELEPAAIALTTSRTDPEQEALMADSVGLALLVVLDRLDPAERLAFVLHDVFAMPFDEIAPIVDRTPAAARQLASRARRRVQGTPPSAASGAVRQQAQQSETVNAFLAALRAGDFHGLMAVLAPDVVVRLDDAAVRTGAPREIVGAENWARGAVAFSQMARGAVQPALINGAAALIWAPGGRLRRALTFTVAGGRITQCQVIADPRALRDLDLSVLDS